MEFSTSLNGTIGKVCQLPINIEFEKQEEFEKQILNYVTNNKRNN